METLKEKNTLKEIQNDMQDNRKNNEIFKNKNNNQIIKNKSKDEIFKHKNEPNKKNINEENNSNVVNEFAKITETKKNVIASNIYNNLMRKSIPAPNNSKSKMLNFSKSLNNNFQNCIL